MSRFVTLTPVSNKIARNWVKPVYVNITEQLVNSQMRKRTITICSRWLWVWFFFGGAHERKFPGTGWGSPLAAGRPYRCQCEMHHPPMYAWLMTLEELVMADQSCTCSVWTWSLSRSAFGHRIWAFIVPSPFVEHWPNHFNSKVLNFDEGNIGTLFFFISKLLMKF